MYGNEQKRCNNVYNNVMNIQVDTKNSDRNFSVLYISEHNFMVPLAIFYLYLYGFNDFSVNTQGIG